MNRITVETLATRPGFIYNPWHAARLARFSTSELVNDRRETLARGRHPEAGLHPSGCSCDLCPEGVLMPEDSSGEPVPA